MRSHRLALNTSISGDFSQYIASPSTSAKRKRDQIDEDSKISSPYITEFPQRLAIPIHSRAEGSPSVFVLSSGDVVWIKDREIVGWKDVFRPKRATENECTSSLSHSCGRIVYLDSCAGSARADLSQSTEVVGVSADGSLLFWQFSPFQHSRAEVHKLLLSNESEEVTCAMQTADALVLGTSLGDCYSVRRQGQEVSAEKLSTATSSLLLDLFHTGARLIGLTNSQTTASQRLIKTIPMDSYLLAIGAKLKVWADYSRAGKERILVEADLLHDIRQDIARHTNQDVNVQVVDANAVPAVHNTALLLVLSTSTKDETDEKGALWLHLLQLSLSPDAASSLIVLQRVSICSDARLHALTPRLHAMDRAWRVFITFARSTLADSTVHCAHVDVLNISLDHRINLSCEITDSSIPSNEVFALHAMQGVDGVCILSDLPRCFCPPLCRSLSRPGSRSVKDLLVSAQSTFPHQRVVAMLWSVVCGETNLEDVLCDLRNVLVSWPQADVLQAVHDVDRQILCLAPDGRLWGSTSSTGTGVEAIHSDRMQLAADLVQDKVTRHQRLLNALQVVGALLNEDDSMLALWQSHQKLLLCIGFSEAMQELRIRLDHQMQAHNKQENKSYATAVLTLLTESFRYAIEHIQHHSVQELTARGMTVVDQFYADTNGITRSVRAFPHILQRQLPRWKAADPALALRVCHTLLSVLLTALQRTREGPGKDGIRSPVIYREDVRTAWLEVASAYHDTAMTYAQHLRTSSSAPSSSSSFSLREEVEGRRVAEFCSIMLDSFEQERIHHAHALHLDAEDFEGSHEAMSEQWRQQYQHAKENCLGILLHLGWPSLAFSLSAQFWYVHGMCAAVDQQPSLLFPRLVELFVEKGHIQGTAPMCMAHGTFAYLEQQKRHAEILKLGQWRPALLHSFLHDRPHLAWIQHLQNKNYDAATVSLVAAAQRTQGNAWQDSSAARGEVEEQEEGDDVHILFSIAKLCGHLARTTAESSSPSAPVLRPPLHTTVFQDERAHPTSGPPQDLPQVTVAPEQFQAAEEEMATQLALDRAREVVAALLPSPPSSQANAPFPARLSAWDLVRKVMEVLHEHQEETPKVGNLSSTDLARLACVALRVLDIMHQSTEKREQWAMHAATSSSSSGRLPPELLHQQTKQTLEHIEDLARQVWKCVLSCTRVSWLEISRLTDISSQWTLLGLQDSLIFYSVAVTAAREIKTARLVAPREMSALMELVQETRLAWYEMDDDSGKIRLTSHENPRIGYVIQAIAQMAMRAASAV